AFVFFLQAEDGIRDFHVTGVQTCALPISGSPAIDAGDNSLIPAQLLTDQRGAGFLRIANGTVDIGAYEVGGECLPFPRTVGTQRSEERRVGKGCSGLWARREGTRDRGDDW